MKPDMIVFLVIMLIAYIPLLFIQSFSQRSVFYGVRIPLGFEKEEELKREDKKYKRNLNICFLITTVLSMFIMLNISEEYSPVIFIVGMFLFIFEGSFLFYVANKRVKAIKKRENWGELLTQGKIVVVDIKAKGRNYEKLSSWYFAPPILVFLWVLFTALKNWNKAEISTLVMLPFTIAVMYFSFISINKSKQNLNGGNVEQIRFQSIKFRRVMGIFIVIMTYALTMLFSVTSLSSMNLIPNEMESTIIGSITIFTLVLSIALMIYSYKVGQGGKNIHLKEEEQDKKDLIINREDDDNYLWGMIYYNPNDPALFVEKRAGVGWTINVARPMGKVFMALTALLIAGSLGMVIYASTSMKVNLEIKQEVVTIKGMYSENINKEDIVDLSLEDSLPPIAMKQNGGAVGNKKLGYFKTTDGEKVKLFIENDDMQVVKVVTKDKTIYINYEEREKTEALFNELKDLKDK